MNAIYRQIGCPSPLHFRISQEKQKTSVARLRPTSHASLPERKKSPFQTHRLPPKRPGRSGHGEMSGADVVLLSADAKGDWHSEGRVDPASKPWENEKDSREFRRVRMKPSEAKPPRHQDTECSTRDWLVDWVVDGAPSRPMCLRSGKMKETQKKVAYTAGTRGAEELLCFPRVLVLCLGC